MLRNSQTREVTEIVLHDAQGGNPFDAGTEGGALENAYMLNGKIVRLPFPPPYFASSSANKVWRTIPFSFTRDGAVEQQLIIIKSDGKTYRLQGGEMEQNTACPATWIRKPVSAINNNRLHLSDGASHYIWDGWQWVTGGLAGPANDSALGFSGTGLTGSYIVSVTVAHLRTNGTVTTRVHESNKAAAVNAVAPANQSITVGIPSLIDSRATHWCVYMSEVSGSTVLRRVTTLPITTTTYTITAEPSSTAPIAPVRNDPVRPTQIQAQWKNRIASRDETNPDQMWFTAFGEVNGGLNGAGEECLPGRGSRNAFFTYGASVSDLVNMWPISDGGRPMTNAIYHDDFLWVFTDKTGFAIVGDGAVLDNIGSRDFVPKRQFAYGAAGSFATCSTPKGLVTLTPEHKLWLWPNGGESIDIGIGIQDRLDSLTQVQLLEAEMLYWNGHGVSWLLITLSDRIAVLDFANPTTQSPYGSWFSLGSQSALTQPTSLCVWNPDGEPVLLSGHSDGSVHQLLTRCQPAHLGLSCNLGQTYLGATVQNSPTTILRTGPISQQEGAWETAMFAQYYALGHNDTTSISTSNPTVIAYYDTIDPRSPQSGVTLTSATMLLSNERRAWFKKSGGSSNGVLARNVQLELKWTTTDTDGAGRPQLINNEVWRLGLTMSARKQLTL